MTPQQLAKAKAKFGIVDDPHPVQDDSAQVDTPQAPREPIQPVYPAKDSRVTSVIPDVVYPEEAAQARAKKFALNASAAAESDPTEQNNAVAGEAAKFALNPENFKNKVTPLPQLTVAPTLEEVTKNAADSVKRVGGTQALADAMASGDKLQLAATKKAVLDAENTSANEAYNKFKNSDIGTRLEDAVGKDVDFLENAASGFVSGLGGIAKSAKDIVGNAAVTALAPGGTPEERAVKTKAIAELERGANVGIDNAVGLVPMAARGVTQIFKNTPEDKAALKESAAVSRAIAQRDAEGKQGAIGTTASDVNKAVQESVDPETAKAIAADPEKAASIGILADPSMLIPIGLGGKAAKTAIAAEDAVKAAAGAAKASPYVEKLLAQVEKLKTDASGLRAEAAKLRPVDGSAADSLVEKATAFERSASEREALLKQAPETISGARAMAGNTIANYGAPAATRLGRYFQNSAVWKAGKAIVNPWTITGMAHGGPVGALAGMGLRYVGGRAAQEAAPYIRAFGRKIATSDGPIASAFDAAANTASSVAGAAKKGVVPGAAFGGLMAAADWNQMTPEERANAVGGGAAFGAVGGAHEGLKRVLTPEGPAKPPAGKAAPLDPTKPATPSTPAAATAPAPAPVSRDIFAPRQEVGVTQDIPAGPHSQEVVRPIREAAAANQQQAEAAAVAAEQARATRAAEEARVAQEQQAAAQRRITNPEEFQAPPPRRRSIMLDPSAEKAPEPQPSAAPAAAPVSEPAQTPAQPAQKQSTRAASRARRRAIQSDANQMTLALDSTNASNELLRRARGEEGSILIPSWEDVKHAAVGLYDGAKDFATWSKEMTTKFGQSIKGHLQDIWDTIQSTYNRLSGETGAVGDLSDGSKLSNTIKRVQAASAEKAGLPFEHNEETLLSSIYKWDNAKDDIAPLPGAKEKLKAVMADKTQPERVRALAREELSNFVEPDKTIWSTPQQEISSADTSINEKRLPETFTKVPFEKGTRNADIGGGRYDNGTEHLASKGVENVIWDPFNRTEEHNKEALQKIADGQADTATVNNVLNVIKEKENREAVIRQAADAIKDDGTAYFLIHEGDRSGNSRVTKSKGGEPKSWQEHRKADSYIDEVEKHFGNVDKKGNLLIATEPKKTTAKEN